MIDPTALRGTGNGLAPTVTHPLNHHTAPSDTLTSFQSSILSSGDEQPNDTNDDAPFQAHIDEAYVDYADEANALLQLSSTSQRTLNETAIPGFFVNKSSLLNVPPHLDPQSSHAPASPLPPNARSIHAPPLAPYLPTTPIMLLLTGPTPLLRLSPRLILVQVLMLMLYLGLTTLHHYPRQDIPMLQLRLIYVCPIIPLRMTILSLIPPTLPILPIPPIPLTSTPILPIPPIPLTSTPKYTKS